MNKPIISFAVIALSVLFGFFYVVPEYGTSQARRGDIDALTKVLATSNEISTLIEKTKQSLGGIDALGLTRFETFLPEKIDTIRLANNIQALGRKNGIILSDIKVEGEKGTMQNTTAGKDAGKGLVSALTPGSAAESVDKTPSASIAVPPAGISATKKYVSTKVTFSFTATYEVFQLLLNDIQTSLGLINITSLSFTPSVDDALAKKSKVFVPPSYQFTMEIETYSLK